MASQYHVTPPLISHYTAPAALIQKLGALAGRTEPQARDVFDLHLLMASARGDEVRGAVTKDLLLRGLDRALELSHDDYSGQVVAFLEPEQQALQGSREHWDDMQTAVVDFIEGLARP